MKDVDFSDPFAAAVWWAGNRRRWLDHAARPDATRCPGMTHRQCLWRARYAEGQIVNLAIRAEWHFRRTGGAS